MVVQRADQRTSRPAAGALAPPRSAPFETKLEQYLAYYRANKGKLTPDTLAAFVGAFTEGELARLDQDVSAASERKRVAAAELSEAQKGWSDHRASRLTRAQANLDAASATVALLSPQRVLTAAASAGLTLSAAPPKSETARALTAELQALGLDEKLKRFEAFFNGATGRPDPATFEAYLDAFKDSEILALHQRLTSAGEAQRRTMKHVMVLVEAAHARD